MDSEPPERHEASREEPAWEVARTVVAPPSSVVKCAWEVFAWGFGVLLLSCVCVSGVLFSVGVCVCVCDLFIFLATGWRTSHIASEPTSWFESLSTIEKVGKVTLLTVHCSNILGRVRDLGCDYIRPLLSPDDTL